MPTNRGIKTYSGSTSAAARFLGFTCINKAYLFCFDREWSEFLATDPEITGSISALPDFLRSKGSGPGSTQPREGN
jgi:hypothetical protein